jgi:D-serine dehydratase
METLDSRIKGLPHSTGALSLPEIAEKTWNILAEDLPLPLAVLRQPALENNRRWMREFLSRTGAKLSPHGKTYMSPQIFRWQLEDGAWAITLATVQQVRVARQAGIERVFLANEMVGPRDIEYVLDELRDCPSFDFYCLVDSIVGVERLAAAARAQAVGRPLKLLVEVGYAGGRTGCRDLETTLTVARLIQSHEPYVALCGVEGFEGLYGYLSASEGVPRVKLFLERLVAAARELDRQNLFGTTEILMSAGGSAYYDLVAEAFAQAHLSCKTSIVLRSGCYFTHDAGWYERLFSEVLDRSSPARAIGARLENALEVWAYVQSVPESGRAILAVGRRDFGHDAGFPVPLKHFRPGTDRTPRSLARNYEIVAINDQHAHMTFPGGAEIDVGDMLALGISHPCTTFDKWQLLYLVDEGYNVLSAVRTYF